MIIPETNQSVNLADVEKGGDLVDLSRYRKADRTTGGKPDPLILHTAYAQDERIYENGQIIIPDAAKYKQLKDQKSNDLVNKFGLVYQDPTLRLHKKLADVLIDTAIDMRDRYNQFTVVMDALRSYDSGVQMQTNRDDLLKLKLLAEAGTSAHNRALAVDSKLFKQVDGKLVEADEHGHLDDTANLADLTPNSRFYPADKMSDEARTNRLNRLRAWQRASIKNKVPVANLLEEFWDDRVVASPQFLWELISCRALCIDGMDGNPQTNQEIGKLRTKLNNLQEKNDKGEMTRDALAQEAYKLFTDAWDKVFPEKRKEQLREALGKDAGKPPALADFLFHKWLEPIRDEQLVKAGYPPQAVPPVPAVTTGVYIAPRSTTLLIR